MRLDRLFLFLPSVKDLYAEWPKNDRSIRFILLAFKQTAKIVRRLISPRKLVETAERVKDKINYLTIQKYRA